MLSNLGLVPCQPICRTDKNTWLVAHEVNRQIPFTNNGLPSPQECPCLVLLPHPLSRSQKKKSLMGAGSHGSEAEVRQASRQQLSQPHCQPQAGLPLPFLSPAEKSGKETTARDPWGRTATWAFTLEPHSLHQCGPAPTWL